MHPALSEVETRSIERWLLRVALSGWPNADIPYASVCRKRFNGKQQGHTRYWCKQPCIVCRQSRVCVVSMRSRRWPSMKASEILYPCGIYYLCKAIKVN